MGRTWTRARGRARLAREAQRRDRVRLGAAAGRAPWGRAGAVVLIAASLASPVLAFDGIAPAGPCGFELRGFRAATPASSGEAAEADDLAGTNVTIGPARMRLTPAHVASGPPGVAVGPPQPGPMRGVGPCDNPGSGCLGPVQPSPLVAVPAAPPPAVVPTVSPAPPPVYTQPGAGQGAGSDPFPGTSP